MYYAHFGLNEAPFRITPNIDLFFAGGNRGAILEALIYAIAQGEGIVKVTGEVGTGKTMLCSMLQSRLPAHIETVYLAHPSVSPEEILHAIAFELQLKVARDASRMEVMQALYAYLLERHAQNKQVVIFIEESQNMPIATLEEVRLLSNLETGKHKLLQIVLFGQPELDENLRQPNIRQLRERITHSFALPPLSAEEVGEYLMFRMRAVGYRGPDVFSAAVVKRIAQASAGLTRRVNLIADKALLAAFSENTHTVQPKHVAAAIRDSEFARDRPASGLQRRHWLMLTGAAAAIVIVVAGVYLFTRPPPLPATGFENRARPDKVPAEEASKAGAPVTTPPAAADAAKDGSVAGAARSEPVASQQVSAADAGERAAHAAAVVSAQQSAQPAHTRLVSAAEAPAPAEIPRKQPDMLDQRLAATLDWLDREAPATHSIQLLGAENSQQLREHLSSIAKFVDISNLYVYRTVARQKPFLCVMYGSFGDREAAQEALDRLPPPLKAFKPYLRTVQGVREEMSRNKTL